VSRTRVILALALGYAVLGVLMNSVGIVILQSVRHFDATKALGSTLEACKDLSVVVASFLLATRIASFGYRRTLISVMAALALTCACASFANSFQAMQLLFVVTGLGFGAAKIATYSAVGLVSNDANDHAAITVFIEGLFMVGILAGIWLFGWFVGSEARGGNWLVVYRVLAAVCAGVALIWALTPLTEQAAVSDTTSANVREMMRLFALPTIIIILAALFLYVLVEQGVGTWLPTFNAEVLHLSPATSVQFSSIYVGALALGRLGSGPLFRRLGWLPVLLFCIVGVAALMLVSLPLAGTTRTGSYGTWFGVPFAAYLFPMIGLLLAPIYPTLCSAALTAVTKPLHATLTGLIVIFSALGGTLGSFIVGMLFQRMSGSEAFMCLLLPLIAIGFALPFIAKAKAEASSG